MQNSQQTVTNRNPPGRARLDWTAALALILVNLVIAVMTMRQQWGFLQVLHVFWFEAIVIGAYNVLKMLVVFVGGEPFGKWIGFTNQFSAVFFGLAAVIFYVVKFGGFTLVTGFVLLALPAWLHQLAPDQSAENSDQFVVAVRALRAVGGSLSLMVLALVVSHGISFFGNFVRRQEYRSTNILKLLFWPYARMAAVIGVVIVAGAVALLVPPVAGKTIFAVLVVFLKLVADLASHLFEHSRKPSVPPVVATASQPRTE